MNPSITEDNRYDLVVAAADDMVAMIITRAGIEDNITAIVAIVAMPNAFREFL